MQNKYDTDIDIFTAGKHCTLLQLYIFSMSWSWSNQSLFELSFSLPGICHIMGTLYIQEAQWMTADDSLHVLTDNKAFNDWSASKETYYDKCLVKTNKTPQKRPQKN